MCPVRPVYTALMFLGDSRVADFFCTLFTYHSHLHPLQIPTEYMMYSEDSHCGWQYG